MCQEKNEEEASPVEKVASIYRYNDSRTTQKSTKED